MFQVSAELKQRVTAKIAECVAIINRVHGITMPPIKVKYDINSARLGGQAVYTSMTVRVNPVFLNKYTEEYLAETIPHEVAHLGVDVIHTTKWDRRHWPQPHGVEWRQMMWTLGVPPERCHQYEAPEGVRLGKPKAKYNYRCSCCSSIIVVGPKRHRALQSGANIYHLSCGRRSTLTFVAEVGHVTYAEAQKQNAAPQPATPQPKAPAAPVLTPARPARVGTKIEQCYEWFKHYKHVPHQGSHRQVCIAVFMQEVDMSAAGASTYYNTCQKKYESEA